MVGNATSDVRCLEACGWGYLCERRDTEADSHRWILYGGRCQHVSFCFPCCRNGYLCWQEARIAFTDILNHIRDTYGSASLAPQQWASDENLSNLISHFTFAAIAVGDQGYYTILNNLYDRYQIRAWDFMNHCDWTQHFHFFAFRSWRGYRYIIPDTVTRHCEGGFGPQGHWMFGCFKACDWMRLNGTNEVKSPYTYWGLYVDLCKLRKRSLVKVYKTENRYYACEMCSGSFSNLPW